MAQTARGIPSNAYLNAAGAIVILSVCYNAPLAWLNGHFFPLSRNLVAVADASLIFAALLLALIRWRPEMTRWLIMIASFAVLTIFFSLMRGQIMPKDFRDVLLIAAFIMLGLAIPVDHGRRIFLTLHIIILLTMIFEIAAPQLYGQILDPANYFINTRGFQEEKFYGADLFNAVRPDDRYFLPQLGWLRASSIFLEPVTFGNYCAFAMLMLMIFWRDFSPGWRIFMVASWAALLVGCDGRFAGAISLLLLVTAPLLRRLSISLAMLYLPITVGAVAIANWHFAFNPLEDTFTGRLSRGMRYLGKLDPSALAGLDIASQTQADAGVAYLITAQSIFGVALLLAFLFLHPGPQTFRQRLTMNGLALIFTLNLLVSNSIFSLKSGAPMWVLAGMILAGAKARASAAEAPGAAKAPARSSQLRPT